MIKSYVLGFPRIGEKRELKRALEGFWAGKEGFSEENLQETAKTLRQRHWKYQQDAGISAISVNDFSFYDLMLDNIIAFGATPPRFANLSGLEQYFACSRGNKSGVAMEMTKWFNTNYHYIVPELSSESKFSLKADKILNEYKEAKANGVKGKVNLIGPITFLALSKTTDGSCPFKHLDALVVEYKKLLEQMSKLDDEILVQFDEPIFVTDKNESDLLPLITKVYNELTGVASNIKIVFATYFEHAIKAVSEVAKTKIYGIALDFIHGKRNFEALETIKNSHLTLFAGVIDGRNIWKSNIDEKVKLVHEISEKIGLQLKEFLLSSHLTEDVENPDYVFAIGGDGTVLRTFNKYMDKLDTVKFLSIHTGHLGFYTDYSVQNYEKIFFDMLALTPKIEEYPLLRVKAYCSNGDLVSDYYSLNEVTVNNHTGVRRIVTGMHCYGCTAGAGSS